MAQTLNHWKVVRNSLRIFDGINPRKMIKASNLKHGPETLWSLWNLSKKNYKTQLLTLNIVPCIKIVFIACPDLRAVAINQSTVLIHSSNPV